MRRRVLGHNGLTSSAIGLGCMSFSQGSGPADDDESIAAIRGAVDAGVTLFDTAMSYGQGHNERLLGRALAGHDGVCIATKFGIVRGDSGVTLDARPEHVRGYCEASLRRLGTEVLDLYYLHRVDPDVPLADTVGAMAELVDAGLVRHLGLSEVTPEQLAAAHVVHPIAAVQFEWSLLWRTPERDIVPAARELGVGLVPYSPLGRGLLTASLSGDEVRASDFRRNDPRFAGTALEDNRRQVRALAELARARGVTAGQLALAWLVARGDDVVPIPGSRRADRVLENAVAGGLELTADDLLELEAAVPASGWSGDRTSFAVPVTAR